MSSDFALCSRYIPEMSIRVVSFAGVSRIMYGILELARTK